MHPSWTRCKDRISNWSWNFPQFHYRDLGWAWYNKGGIKLYIAIQHWSSYQVYSSFHRTDPTCICTKAENSMELEDISLKRHRGFLSRRWWKFVQLREKKFDKKLAESWRNCWGVFSSTPIHHFSNPTSKEINSQMQSCLVNASQLWPQASWGLEPSKLIGKSKDNLSSLKVDAQRKKFLRKKNWLHTHS